MIKDTKERTSEKRKIRYDFKRLGTYEEELYNFGSGKHSC